MQNTRDVDFTPMQLSGRTLFHQNPRLLVYSLYSLCYVSSDLVKEYYHEVIPKMVDDGVEHYEE